MDELTYLKLKIVRLEFQNICAKAEQIVGDARARYNEALIRVDLDPCVTYIMDDATCSVTPVPQPSEQTVPEQKEN